MAKPSRGDLRDEIREAAEADLVTFIRLVAPHRILGSIHEELCHWWQRSDALDNQIVLLPRDHQKSAMIAYRVAWWITNHPDTTVLYCSATADLAEKQLKFIQNIFTSDVYRYYWPEMVNESENKRDKWTTEEFNVDHPKRKAEGVRDATCKAVGITANTTGLHCHVAVLDDVVVPGNAYTEQGREDVKAFVSQLSSIETTDAQEWVVGTRYHPADLYRDLIDRVEEFEDELGEWIEKPVYEVFERRVETNGEFLWPVQRRTDGKTFGFDARILARKKAKYLHITQFYAQYYNDPNVPEAALIDQTRFQYYARENLRNVSGSWYLGDQPLHTYAAIDFAYSTSARADYTAIVVVGVMSDNRLFILDIDRFKTNKMSVMYDRVKALYAKWRFRRLRAECTAAQAIIVQEFQETMRRDDMLFTIDTYYPPRTLNKEERIAVVLEPRYANQSIYHYKGGNCQSLEEELLVAHPEHDDIKDSLAAVVAIAKPPAAARISSTAPAASYHPRFGGIAFRG